MRYIFFVFNIFFVINLGIAQTASLTILIKGIKNQKGTIKIGLFDSKDNFPKMSNKIKGVTLSPDKLGLSYTFKDIKAGVYAIATYHDENNNAKIDRNFFGMPTESYGFSLNKYGIFGPPDFEKVSFELRENENKSLIINLK